MLPSTVMFYIAVTFIVWFVIYVFRFYTRVRQMPPGLLPLPLIGSMWAGTTLDSVVEKSRKFGAITTVWLGPKPMLFINDISLAKTLFNDGDYLGTFLADVAQLVKHDTSGTGLVVDYGHKYVILRKLFLKAMRHVVDILPSLTAHTVDDLFDQGAVEFDARQFCAEVNKTIISHFTIGESTPNTATDHSTLWSMSDRIARNLKQLYLVFLFPTFIPFKLFTYFQTKAFYKTIEDVLFKSFDAHVRRYEPGQQVHDFCDALLHERHLMLEEQGHLKQYLSDDETKYLLHDFFFGGIETNKFVMCWVVLFMAYYPRMQIRMKNEIKNNIGQRMPVPEDRGKCDFVNAFINEVIRYRYIVLFTFPHKTLKETKLKEYLIPKGTLVYVTKHCMTDEKLWTDVNMFDPNRFLRDERLDVESLPHFQPFGVGKRKCVGERLGYNMIFLVIVRLLQTTEDKLFCLPEGTDETILEPRDKSSLLQTTKKFKIFLNTYNS